MKLLSLYHLLFCLLLFASCLAARASDSEEIIEQGTFVSNKEYANGELVTQNRIQSSIVYHDRNFYSEYSKISVTAKPIGNSTFDRGGAVTCGSDMAFSNNGLVLFLNNSAHGLSNTSDAYGGAVYCEYAGLTIENNEYVHFDANLVSGSVRTLGGAIYAGLSSTTLLQNNGLLVFSSNLVQSTSAGKMLGGAIYNKSTLSIVGNDYTEFRKNVEKRGDNFTTFALTLRSIYSSGNLTLSVTDNQKIVFYDSIYASGNVTLNSEYIDSSGETRKGNGIIIFSGATTEEDLQEIKGRFAVTEQEILESRTSEIATNTKLNGGRLVVEDKAILKGQGITATANSGATVQVKDGALEQSGYVLTFNAGTTLEVEGASTISASSIDMLAGSALSLVVGEVNLTTAALELSGDLNLDVTTTVTVSSGTNLDAQGRYRILSTADGSNVTALNNDTVTLLGSLSAGRTYWDNGTLWLDFALDLSTATWTNASGNSVWDVTSVNWTQDGFGYAYTDGVNVVFGNESAGAVTLKGELAPKSVLVNNDSTFDYNFEGHGNLTGEMILSKNGNGKLIISTANSFTGGTVINNGTVEIRNDVALGAGCVSLNGGTLEIAVNGFANEIKAIGNSGLMVREDYVLELNDVITNSGTLTMRGSFNVSSLTLNTTAATHVDVNGNSGTSGFAKDVAYSVKLVNGGTVVNNGATVKHGTHTLELGTDGYATTGGDVHYDTYLLTGTATATTSTIHGKSSSAVVLMNGGSLTVNDTATVTATGGNITLTSGTLNGTLTNTSITANGGTLAADVTGSKTLTVDGNVMLTGLVSTSVILKNGCLTADMDLSAGQSLTFNGGGMAGDVQTSTDCSLILKLQAALIGDLTLDGGSLALNGKTLTLTGTLNLLSDTALDVSSYGIGEYKLFSFGELAGSLDKLCIDSKRYRYALSQENNALMLTVKALNNTLTWDAPKGVWMTGGSFGSGVFESGDDVIFRTAAAVTITGAVEPGEMLVDSAAAVKFAANAKTPGSGIIGKGTLIKNGAGVLTLNAGNTYSGGTTLNEGTIKAAGADAFGTGDIIVNGGTLDLGSKAVENDILLCGTALIKGDAKYLGRVTVDGEAALTAKTSYKGKTLIGSGSTLTLGATATMAGSLDVGGTLNITAVKGLTVAKGNTLTLNGGTVNGLVNVAAGAQLMLNGGTLTTAPVLTGGKLVMPDAEGDILLSGTGTLALGTQSVGLKGKGELVTDAPFTVTGGKVALTALNGYDNALEVSGGTLALGKVAVTADVNVSGSAALNNGTAHSGDVNVNGELIKGSVIKLTHFGQNVNLNQNGVMNGTISGMGMVNVNADVDASLGKMTNAYICLNSGTLTNNKGLKLAKNQMLLFNGGHLNLAGKVLTTAAGTSLNVMDSATLNGALTLAGGLLVLDDGADLSVSGALTLSKSTTLIVDGTATLTFGTLTAPKKGTLEEFFGVSEGVTISRDGNTLTFSGYTAVAAPVAPSAPETETTPAPALAPAVAALAVEAAAARPLGDALVMADWGIVDANRAFTGTLQSRRDSGVLLADGQGMAWVSAMGGVARHGSENGHNGADVNLNGAAVGVEHMAGANSVLGLAVGHTWSRIGATGMQHLRQDTAHVALYGQTKLPHGFTAEWSAAYGDTDSKGSFYGTRETWSQKSTAISARLNKTHELTDSTAVRGFAGLNYDATDAASIHGMHTGSIQRLQGEVGAGITHRADKLTTYAEASVTTDLARNAPAVDFGAWRQNGATPGRTGLNLTLGAAYELTDKWSVNAAYHVEAAERATQHSFNVGAGMKF